MFKGACTAKGVLVITPETVIVTTPGPDNKKSSLTLHSPIHSSIKKQKTSNYTAAGFLFFIVYIT